MRTTNDVRLVVSGPRVSISPARATCRAKRWVALSRAPVPAAYASDRTYLTIYRCLKPGLEARRAVRIFAPRAAERRRHLRFRTRVFDPSRSEKNGRHGRRDAKIADFFFLLPLGKMYYTDSFDYFLANRAFTVMYSRPRVVIYWRAEE